MSELSPQDQQILEDLVSGDLTMEDDRARDLLSRHPEKKKEVEDLLRTVRGLDSLDDLRDEILDEVSRGSIERSVSVEEVLASRLPPPQPSASRRYWPALAAATLIGLVVWALSDPADEPVIPDGVLGGVSNLSPSGTVSQVSEFTWESRDPVLGFELEITVPPAQEPIRIPVDAPPWVPSAEQLESFRGKTVHWRVFVIGSGVTPEPGPQATFTWEP